MIKNNLLVFSFILFFTSFLFSETDFSTIDFSPVKKENIGLVFKSLETGKIVFKLNENKHFSYASNLKLVTTATSLEYLGGGFRFLTIFSYNKSTKTLFIKATGDPSVVNEKLWSIAQTLKRKGIGKIKTVIVDDFIYGKPVIKINGHGKGDNAYLANVSALSLNYNSVEIAVYPTKVGEKARVFLGTPGNYFILKNSATTENGAENRLIVGSMKKGKTTEIVVKGSIGVNFKKGVLLYKKIYTPTQYFVKTLLYFLGNNQNIPIKRLKIAENLLLNKQNVNFLYKSPQLRDILTLMNRFSSNFLADSIQTFMGKILKGDATKGVEVLNDYIFDNFGEKLNIINGSGLGNGRNLIKPLFFINLLSNIKSDYLNSIDFFFSLPVAGEDGTLKKVKHTTYFGQIRAKTGTLTGVVALSGIMQAKSGKLYIFTFVINNFKTRNFKTMWRYRDKIMQYFWEKM